MKKIISLAVSTLLIFALFATVAVAEVDDSTNASEHEHILGDWEIVFDATCEDEGMTGRRCLVCNVYVETQVIDAYGCLRGDINNDGNIDADDYILLKRVYSGTVEMENLPLPQTAIYRCDVNCDSLINADDYIALKRAYFGNYTVG